MENQTTQTALQAELARIEAEAENNSRLICDKADALENAARLCDQLNAATTFVFTTEVHVTYHDDDCDVVIYGHEDGAHLLRTLDAMGIAYQHIGQFCTGTEHVACPDFPGVVIAIKTELLQMHCTLKAAA